MPTPLPPAPTALPTPVAASAQTVTINLPTGGNLYLDLGGVVHTIGAVAAVLITATILMRLSKVFVSGLAETLLEREHAEGTSREMSPLELRKRQDTIEELGINVIRSFIAVIAGLIILETAFQVDIGPAVAGLGIVGIAIGLGTQHLVRDYMNGILILIENQYDKGDVVRIAGLSGTVEDFTLRRTTLRDSDGALHTVPNGEVSVATNLTRMFANVIQDVQVVYETEIERAETVVDSIGKTMAGDPAWSDRILEPPHVDQVAAFGEFGVTLRITAKVRASEQWAVAGELRKRVLTGFAANHIEIAQPRRVVVTAASERIASRGDRHAEIQTKAQLEPVPMQLGPAQLEPVPMQLGSAPHSGPASMQLGPAPQLGQSRPPHAASPGDGVGVAGSEA
jgi:moderate conductance mechanosensitive channel